jgi:hypothetical protein
MPEPHGNDRAVHSPLQQVQGHGVAQDMDGDAFAFQRRTDLGGSFDMTDQQVMHAVGAETRASGIGEQNLPDTAWRFAEPGFQHGDRRFGERYTTFLAALPDHTNVSTRSERDIIAAARAKEYYGKVMANNGHGPTNAFARPVARKKLAGG